MGWCTRTWHCQTAPAGHAPRDPGEAALPTRCCACKCQQTRARTPTAPRPPGWAPRAVGGKALDPAPVGAGRARGGGTPGPRGRQRHLPAGVACLALRTATDFAQERDPNRKPEGGAPVSGVRPADVTDKGPGHSDGGSEPEGEGEVEKAAAQPKTLSGEKRKTNGLPETKCGKMDSEHPTGEPAGRSRGGGAARSPVEAGRAPRQTGRGRGMERDM